MNLSSENSGESPDRKCCSVLQKLSYGLGHIYNDLCAAMWFSYTLFYLQVVLRMEATSAGTLLMIGQVVDALATPLSGWAIDRTGHKRIWHFFGTAAVAVGFSLIYSIKPSENNGSQIFIYFIWAIIVFQIGWAVVQIAHLSLIPEISRSHQQSSDLTTIRYTASVCCSISVYIITLVILQNNRMDMVVAISNIGPNDFYKFKEIAMLITFIGLIASLLFYCGILKSPSEYEMLRDETEDANNLGEATNGRHFLQSSVIYLVSLLYMTSRLFTTLNLIYIPLFIEERSDENPNETDGIRQTIATVPLVCNLASLATSILLKYRPKSCNDKITYLFGSLFGLSASIWIAVGLQASTNSHLYAIATFLGISGSSTMVASLCLTANYVKTNGYGGSLIYSTVTFTDKLISGGLVLLVQNSQCQPKSLCPNFYKNVLTYICGGVSLIGMISLLVLQLQVRKNHRLIKN